MASVSATFSRSARADAVATWATSRAWVSRVRWWSSGKTNTWSCRRGGGRRGVQDAVAVALEARPRWCRAPRARRGSRPRGPGAPGRQQDRLPGLALLRRDGERPRPGRESAWASRSSASVRGRPWWPPTARLASWPDGTRGVRCAPPTAHRTPMTRSMCRLPLEAHGGRGRRSPPVAWNGSMAGFVDEAQLNVRAATAAPACVSFRREGPVTKGGPNGGDGGSRRRRVAGGRPQRAPPAPSGTTRTAGPQRRPREGQGPARASGDDLVVPFPRAPSRGPLHRRGLWPTSCTTATGGRRRRAAGRPGQRPLPLQPAAGAELRRAGRAGEERWLKLELKLMADVALVGVPNAGKSTLICRDLGGQAKIADYPFTTLEPQPRRGSRSRTTPSFVGRPTPRVLIEERQRRRWRLGHQFLRHVEARPGRSCCCAPGPGARGRPRVP
jgi:GTP-binding protein